MFGLGRLFYVILLLTNAIAVLSEDRFLARVGWSAQSEQVQYGFTQDVSGSSTIKSKLINLISAVRTLMRIPLIAVNAIVIVYELVLG